MKDGRRRRICVVLVDRANYGRMWPVMRAIQDDADLELLTICAGTMVLERFHLPERVVEEDGFSIDGRVYMELEGSLPSTMAKSVGYGVVEFANELQRLRPDILLLIGDRYEALAATIAAAYQNIPIAHIQGGEVSGSIDESARHAITKFAHIHFASTARAREYIVRMGEPPEAVYHVGCPSGDNVQALPDDLPEDLFIANGTGAQFKSSEPFFLVVFHPVTTEFGQEAKQATSLLKALERLEHRTVWLWPNIDAGSCQVSGVLRRYREFHRGNGWLCFCVNFEPVMYQKVLRRAACAIGNSSSFVRDSTFFGTPVVLIGDRQEGRETAENALAVPPDEQSIHSAVVRQMERGRYAPSILYGDGQAAGRIVEILKGPLPRVQKRLHYVFES